jgi:Leucine-rich repeat (LRR) protein
MEQFIREILAGEPARGVVDLCLDYELIGAQAGQRWTQFAGLSDCVDLEILSCSGHALHALHGLPPLPRLRQLCLSLNALETLAGFPPLPALEVLDLSHNLLSSLADLPASLTLKVLHAGHNHLQATSWLHNFPNLQDLTLSGNRGLRSLDGISTLQHLKSLFLRQCFVMRWDALAGLPHLEELSISPRAPQGLDVLAELPALHTLYIQATELRGGFTLPPLPSLTKLSIIGGSGLDTMEGFAHSPKLSSVNLRGNGLRAIPKGLDQLPDLQLLDLSDNPLQQREGLAGLPSSVVVRLANAGG